MSEGAPKPPRPEMPPIPEKFKIGSIWETSPQDYALVVEVNPEKGSVKLAQIDLLFTASNKDNLILMSNDATIEDGSLKYKDKTLNYIAADSLPKKFKNKSLVSQLAEKIQMLREQGVPEHHFANAANRETRDADVLELDAADALPNLPSEVTAADSDEKTGDEANPASFPDDPEPIPEAFDARTWKPAPPLEPIVPDDPTPETAESDGSVSGSESDTIRTTAEKERLNMEQSEREYLDEYKKFHATKKFWNLKEPRELELLKGNYDTNRLAYARALDAHSADRIRNDERFTDDALRERLQRRLSNATPEMRERVDAWLEDLPGYKEHLQKKYDSIIKYREIVSRAADKKLDARFEGIDSRKQGLVKDAFRWLASTNAKFEEQVGGKMSARIIRAAATTVVVGGAAAAFGSGVGIAAFAGWGALNIGRIVMAGTAGAMIGEAVARGYGVAMRGDANRSSKANDRGAIHGLDDDSLARYDKIQKTIQSGTNERVRREQMNAVRIAASILSGAGIGAAVGLALDSSSQATEPIPAQPSGAPAPSGAAPEAVVRPDAPIPEAVRTGTQPQEASRPAAPQPEATVSSNLPESADGSVTLREGGGANELLRDLRAELRSQYGDDVSNAPQSVQKILSGDIRGWSDRFEFLNEQGSVLLHEGATLEINASGELVLTDPNGIGDVTLLDREGNEFHGTQAAGDTNGVDDVERYRHMHTGNEDLVARTEATPLEQKQELGRVVDEVQSARLPAQSSAPAEQLTPIDTSLQMSNGGPEAGMTDALPTEPSENTGGFTTLDDLVSSGNSDGTTNESFPSTAGSIPETDGTATLGDLVTEVPQGTDLPAPSGEGVPPGFGTSATQNPLPAEAMGYQMQGTAGEVFVHSGGSAEKNFQLAKEYAQAHPGTKVYFDNAKERWGGLRSSTARIGSISFAGNAEPVFNPQETDTAGRPITSVEQRLERRISI